MVSTAEADGDADPPGHDLVEVGVARVVVVEAVAGEAEIGEQVGRPARRGSGRSNRRPARRAGASSAATSRSGRKRRGHQQRGLVEGQLGLRAGHHLAEALSQTPGVHGRHGSGGPGYGPAPCIPGSFAAATPRPSRGDHGRHRADVVTYRQLDDEANRLAHAAQGAGPAPGRPRRLLHREPGALPTPWPGARTTPGSSTRPSAPASPPRRRPTSSTTAAPGSSSPRRSWPSWPPSWSALTPGVELRLLVPARRPGVGAGLRATTPRRIGRASGRAAGRSGGRQRHALQLGHHRSAQGRQGARRRRMPLDTPTARQRPVHAAVRRDRRTPCTSPRPRSTTPLRCASAWPCTSRAARWW